MKNKYKGFTLIELVIVIAIIGILVAVLVMLIDPAAQLKKGRDGVRKSDLRQIQAALEMYRADIGYYPPQAEVACGLTLASGTTTYLQKVPCDPKNTGQYIYTYVPSGSPLYIYSLYACLENTNDLQKDPSNNGTYCMGETTNWSYTLQNP